MIKTPSADKEASTPSGRRLWLVTLGVFGLLVVLGIAFLLLGKHIGFATH